MSGPQPYRQKEALNFIRAQVETHGIPPSLEEIAGFLGSRKSKASALRIVNALVAEGHLRRLSNRWRAIELIETKDHHAPDCGCRACSEARYIAQLKLIKGLKVDPPAAVVNARLVGIRLLSQETRASLLGTPNNAAPRTRTALPREVG